MIQYSPKRRLTVIITILILVALIACNFPLKFGAQSPVANPPNDAPEDTIPPEIIETYDDEEPFDPEELESLPESTAEPWNIRTAAYWPMISADVGSEGGVLTVTDPDSALNGFSITIPAGAYGQSVHFEVDAAEITNHQVPADLELITPLIRVDNGEVEAQEFLELHLPRPIADGRFAMLFTYDPETGTLDALPLVEIDGTHITAITTHFSNILGIEVDTAALDALNIQTGFKQGRNNWQFTNYGSYIEPNGHCAGQTLMAMYYFTSVQGPALYGAYDNYGNDGFPQTPVLQDDDRLAYRACSVAQARSDWKSEVNKWWYKVQEVDPRITYYSFALALKASNEPQLVGIHSAKGGHALILYGKYADRFYISDPNYPAPNARRYISYNRGTKKFRTYYSGPNADDLGTPYPWIYYLNKYGVMSQHALAAVWAEMQAGSVGQDHFPEYQINYQQLTLAGGLTEEAITRNYAFVYDLNPEISFTSTAPVGITIYDRQNFKQGVDYQPGPVALVLDNPNGTPYLFAVYGKTGGKWRWIDGRWITFIRSITGKWHGAACSEGETNPYRWEIDVTQTLTGEVEGSMYFHRCPGGGAAMYSLRGVQDPQNDFVVLNGTYTGGRGDLGASAPRNVQFTIRRNQSPEPNYAP